MGWYFAFMQTVVDHNYLFKDICIGWPSRVHYARFFTNSFLFKKMTSGELRIYLHFKVTMYVVLQGYLVGPFLIEDSEWPFLIGDSASLSC